MPKAKARKRRKVKSSVSSETSRTGLSHASTSAASPPVQSQAALPSKPAGTQGLVMAGMVALGCWGMAISFIFFTTDPNRYMYGGIAVLMALMWSYMFGVRVRNARRQK
jgi:hypothetical protein